MHELENLYQCLEEKRSLLTSLGGLQAWVTNFLVKPRWSQYFEVIEPVELLLADIQALQIQEKKWLGACARILGKPHLSTLKGLALSLDGEAKARLLQLMGLVRREVANIKRIQLLMRHLQQAHADFVTNWVGASMGAGLQHYNAAGQTYSSPLPNQVNEQF